MPYTSFQFRWNRRELSGDGPSTAICISVRLTSALECRMPENQHYLAQHLRQPTVFSPQIKNYDKITKGLGHQRSALPAIERRRWIYTLRSASRPLLHVPWTVYSSRIFSVAASTLWNSLPADNTNTASLTAFRKRLKTFYFTILPLSAQLTSPTVKRLWIFTLDSTLQTSF